MKFARLPFLFLAAISLLSGIAAGLARMGVVIAEPAAAAAPLHGVLMVSGFFGTLIGLERAVAHGAKWSYSAPLFAGAGGVIALAGQGGVAAWTATASALCFSAVNLSLARRHVADFTVTLVAAGVAWTVANLSWALGAPSQKVLPWLIAFLTLTIFAERRELGRVMVPGPNAGRGFVAVVTAVIGGAALLSAGLDDSRRVLAAGLLAMSAWLAVFDVARYTVKKRGLTRFMAVALIAGYFWLAAGALAMLLAQGDPAGARYDAFVHALMLGFVFSMVFAHAPVIFPAVLGTSLAYSPIFYLHLALLQLSLALRWAGDFGGIAPLRTMGGIGNAATIVLFIGVNASAVIRARKVRNQR